MNRPPGREPRDWVGLAGELALLVLPVVEFDGRSRLRVGRRAVGRLSLRSNIPPVRGNWGCAVMPMPPACDRAARAEMGDPGDWPSPPPRLSGPRGGIGIWPKRFRSRRTMEPSARGIRYGPRDRAKPIEPPAEGNWVGGVAAIGANTIEPPVGGIGCSPNRNEAGRRRNDAREGARVRGRMPAGPRARAERRRMPSRGRALDSSAN